MELLKIYEGVLNESEIQSCVKKFGYELFGSEFGGKEKNTGIENTYADEIKDFTDNRYGEEMTPEFVNAIKNLKGCVKQYPDVLIPEKTTIYRGLTISANYFINKKQPINYKTWFEYQYSARNPIQSWSTSMNQASMFGNHEILNEIAQEIDFNEYTSPESRIKLLEHIKKIDLRFAFVLEYETNTEEFLFKSKYFNLLSAQGENEVLRIDNKPIFVKSLFNQHDDVFLSMSGLRLIKLINIAISES